MFDCCLCIPSIQRNELQINHQYPSTESIQELNLHSKAMSFHLISRLPHFLQYRMPPSRPYLQPGTHWVWNSLRKKMKQIVVMMIMNAHLCEKDDLKYKTKNECLLTNRIDFKTAEEVTTVFGHDLDGSYIVYDKHHDDYI